MREAFADYLIEEKELSSRTLKQYLYRWEVAEQALGKPIEDFSTDDLFKLKRQLRDAGYSSSHIKGVFVAVRQVRIWGVVIGLWSHNGVEHVPLPKATSESSRPLSVERARLLLNVCEGSLETRLVYCGLYLGTRREESAGVAPWEEGWVDILGKGNKRRQIPVHPCLEAKRDAILAHPLPHRESLQNAKERIEERVGFSFVTHQLRKTFSTLLHDAGVSSLCRRDLLGHTLGLDGVYTEVSRREKQEAIAALPY